MRSVTYKKARLTDCLTRGYVLGTSLYEQQTEQTDWLPMAKQILDTDLLGVGAISQ